ncbi:hypothetical protein [Vreelandella nanhaiensis]|uniref:hypothetical protein n=1 Tax=Vreelandella nanhaiensis TaxID=1258546 RepID=UPI001FE9D5FF|nr:hypothetical protein [Halomonas nanhaiensis]
MQKTPIILPIALSKYASLLQAGLALGLCLLSFCVLGSWVGSGVSIVAALLLWRSIYAQPKGVLYLTNADNAMIGRWRLPYGELGDEQLVRCDYLGPWLVGIWVGPQRLWLWPDSLPRDSHRLLRRLCLRAGR